MRTMAKILVCVVAMGLLVDSGGVAQAEIQLFWSMTGINDPSFVYSPALANFLPYFVPPVPVTQLAPGTYDLFLWGRFVENYDPNDPNFLPAFTRIDVMDLQWLGAATHAQNAAYRQNKTGFGAYTRWENGSGILLDDVMFALATRGVEFILPPDGNNDLYYPNTQEFLIGAARITGAGGQSATMALAGIAMSEIGGDMIPPVIVVPAEVVFTGTPTDAACCFSWGECQMLTQSDCTAALGNWQGAGTSCTPNPCPQPAACCLSTGVCHMWTQSDCTSAGVPCAITSP